MDGGTTRGNSFLVFFCRQEADLFTDEDDFFRGMSSAMSTGASSALRLREKLMNARARKARLRRGMGADESPPALVGVDVATNIDE